MAAGRGMNRGGPCWGVPVEACMGDPPKIRDAGGKLHADPVAGAPGGSVDLGKPGIVLLTGAYCPSGCPLITEDAPKFDGFPGIVLSASAGGKVGRLTLSPFQGDSRKQGPAFAEGAILTLQCPICAAELPAVAPCGCGEGGQFVAMYTVRVPDPDYVVGVCRRWGCFRSFVKDAGRVVTEYRVNAGLEA